MPSKAATRSAERSHHHANMNTGFNPFVAQSDGQAISPLLQLAIAENLAAVTHRNGVWRFPDLGREQILDATIGVAACFRIIPVHQQPVLFRLVQQGAAIQGDGSDPRQSPPETRPAALAWPLGPTQPISPASYVHVQAAPSSGIARAKSHSRQSEALSQAFVRSMPIEYSGCCWRDANCRSSGKRALRSRAKVPLSQTRTISACQVLAISKKLWFAATLTRNGTHLEKDAATLESSKASVKTLHPTSNTSCPVNRAWYARNATAKTSPSAIEGIVLLESCGWRGKY